MKKYSIYIITVLMSFGLTGCSDFLEQETGNRSSVNEQLATKEGVVTALYGTYTSLENLLRSEAFTVYADLQGGNLSFSPTASGTNKGQISVSSNVENVYAFQDLALSSHLSSFYSSAYSVINQVNLILEFVPLLPNTSEQDQAAIQAQCKTIRGYVHFLLLQMYAQNYTYTTDASHLGVVYQTLTLNSGISYAERATVKDCYDFLISDLNDAISLYQQENTLLEGPDYSYFNSYSAKALLARIYLAQNNWEQAYELANDVIENSGLTLSSSATYVEEWENTDAPINEVLLEFSVPRDAEGNVGASMSAHYGISSATNYGKYVASLDLVTLFEENDVRKELFISNQLATLYNDELVDETYYFTKKYQDNAGYTAFRLSELYFIRAEAAIYLNNETVALQDINTIKERAGAAIITTSTDLLTELSLEKRKEFCFEGHLFFDIARTHQNVERNQGCISNVCSLSYPSPKLVLPIPQSSININSNIEQNESY
ncbi:RagB/SusD family nutrient uptake outer membrane protein [Wenyingzhuangia sp. IMCC45467]